MGEVGGVAPSTRAHAAEGRVRRRRGGGLRSRAGRLATAVSALAVGLAGLATPVPPATGEEEEPTLEEVAGRLDAAPLAAALPLAPFRAAGDAPRVTVISTGVDTAVLPEALRPQVTTVGAAGDQVGLGTLAVSQLLQLAPGAVVTMINVYPSGRVDHAAIASAFGRLAAGAADVDAVLYDVPPREYLDPVTTEMALRRWAALDEAVSSFGLPGARGPVYGTPLSDDVRTAQMKGVDSTSASLINGFATSVNRWNAVQLGIDKLAAAGVAVVSPAGDEEAGLQRVHGVAGLPKVIAVGAAEAGSVAPRSASGPSPSGGVKPDVVAPAGVVGLLPESSPVASALRAAGKLDASLAPDWAAGEPPTRARTRLVSTFSAAPVVAATVATMAAQGIRDTSRQRAALAAAAVPVAGTPVWRQGAGVLRFAPDAELVATTPLVLGAADLGVEPAAGDWSTRLGVANGRLGPPTVRMRDFAGVGPDARTSTATREGADAPPVYASVSNDGVVISAPAGDSSHEGGLYCGYTSVPVVGTGTEVDPRLQLHGVPAGAEQVPTCLVNGSSLDSFGFYLHQLPAENQTFALLPVLPPGASVLDHPLMILPVNPLHTTLASRVTGRDGVARFTNVPPGYYRVRLFSDYGAPLSWTVRDEATGADVSTGEDIGKAFAYQSFDALVLSAVCRDPVTASRTTEDAAPSPCTQAFLEARFGPANVAWDNTTATHLVTLAGGAQLRMAFGFLKKAVGVGVAGRVVDHLGFGDLTDASADLASVTDLAALEALGSLGSAWTFAPGRSNAEDTEATFDPAYLAAPNANTLVVGVQRYDFNVPAPNHSAVMDVNLRYAVESASLAVVVQIGTSWAVGTLTPNGRLDIPRVSPEQGIDPSRLQLEGKASDAAHFQFRFLTRGARKGSLYLLYTPLLDANRGQVSPLSRIRVADLSFQLGTWANSAWPPAVTSHGQGHSYAIDPNYSAVQMNRPCRLTRSHTVTPGGVSAEVCEDWGMVVHSPLDHAATVNLLDARSQASLVPEMQAAGARYANPHRGVHDATFTLAYANPTPAGIEAALAVRGGVRTNGRFWEQLAVPKPVIAAHPGPIRVEVLDMAPGRASGLFPHVDGGQPVPPYVHFAPGK